MAVAAHLVEEHHLVGKDVGRIAVVVVEVAQLGSRKHGGPADGTTHVAPTWAMYWRARSIWRCRFWVPNVSLARVRHVVDHRVPDRAGVLQHVHVDVTEGVRQHVQIHRSGVVHVESGCRAVGNHQRRVADRAVGRCAQRDDHDVQVALGPADPVLDRVGGLEEAVKAQLLQRISQIGHRIVRQQHHRVLVDVRSQKLGVEVVLVQVRDVQVVAVTQSVPVQRAVVREGKPGGEVGRVDPGVTQDAARLGLDQKAGMTDAGDLH